MTKRYKRLSEKIAKFILSIIFLFIVSGFIPTALSVLVAQPASASSWWETAQQGGLDEVGKAYGDDEPKDVRMVVIDIIRVILGFLGLIAVVLTIYAGFKWLLSRGNEDQVSEAKKILTASVIGLIIILSAYIIADFVIEQIYGATTGELPI